MEPEFREGEIIIVNPHIAWEVGNYVIVKNSDVEATFNQLKEQADMWVIFLPNPKYKDIEVDNRQPLCRWRAGEDQEVLNVAF